MSKKVLVLGNSQVVTLKDAASTNRYPFFLDCDWLSIPDGWGPKFKLYAGSVKADYPSDTKFKFFSQPEHLGQVGFSLSDYHTIIVSACGAAAFRNENQRHFMLHNSLSSWPKPADQEGCSIISRQVFECLLEETLEGCGTVRFLKDLDSISADCRVFVQPWPLPSQSLLSDKSWIINQRFGSSAPMVISQFFQAQYRSLTEIFAGFTSDIKLLSYPNPAWLELGYTPAEYSVGDPWHFTSSYGELVLEQLTQAL